MGFAAAFTGVNTTSPVASYSGFSSNPSANSLAVAADGPAAEVYTLQLWAANFTASNSYGITSYTGGLAQIGTANNPAGTENLSVSRSAMAVWAGTPPLTGVPAHVIETASTPSQACSALISLTAAGGSAPLVTPTIIGHTTLTSNGTASTYVVDPNVNLVGSAPATGDWILMVNTSAGTAAQTRTSTPPAGWTSIVPAGTVGTGTMTFAVWAHKRAGGESTYTWSQTTSESLVTHSRLIYIRGADDISSWATGTFQNRATSGTTTTNIAPTVTAATAHSLGLLLSSDRTVAGETDAQVTCDNFSKQWFDNALDDTLFVATKDMVAAGATGSVTVTYPNAHSQNGIAGILAIPGVVASTSGLALKISNGTTLVDATFKLADGNGGLTTPGGYKVIRPGYASVTQMLAQNKFYCAHRGGSLDFPEMSLYAYGQSALNGYPALELSLARTSDGVWFGLHDASLDRTSLGTGGGAGTTLMPASMTWAQVQSYSILGTTATNNSGQPNRPYMRWEEIIAMYYSSHVIFVDPKVAIGFRSEILNLMDALPGSTDKFVAKYYGVSGGVSNTSGWCFDAQQRGYKTWGYFYAADSANYATYAPRWDILGMDYGAAQSYWDDLTAAGPGKPIMGHICPTLTAANTAFSKGADGVMVSGVLSVVPPAIT
jgi:hypothetical protein